MNDRPVLAEATTPEGVRVVLFEDTWREHILDPEAGHAEMASHLDGLLAAIVAPDHREQDEHAGRERFFKQGVGPSRWLMAVVSFEQGASTGHHRGWLRTWKVASRMDAMNIKINGLVFDRANYDADGDVLYLTRGESAEASDAALTPEGHGVRYDADGRVMGVTIINARMLLDRDGHLTITLPHEVHVDASDLAGALS